MAVEYGPREISMIMGGDPLIKQVIFFSSFLIVPVLLALIWAVIAKPRLRIPAAILLVPALLGFYARFVEPHLLIVKEHTVRVCGEGLPGTLRAAVISDMHYGVYSNTPSLDRVVRRLNAEEPDLVLIPGDFTSFLAEKSYEKTFDAFVKLEAPAYAVMGNHDFGLPGEDVADALAMALDEVGVTVLNPGVATFGSNGKFLRIVGHRDFYEQILNDEPFAAQHEVSALPTIFLEHNPDMIKTSDIGPFDLFVSGHTHGGQILIPGLTCRMTGVCDTLRYGYAETPVGNLFVTSGIGMTGLPLRFRVPPRIDMLTMELDRCRPALAKNPFLTPNLPRNERP